MTCYSYRRGEVRETLYDHLVKAYLIALERWEVGAVARKISTHLPIGVEEARESVFLAVLLHDLGKAAHPLQEACQKGDCTRFPQHYLLSAAYAYIALREALGIDLAGADELLKEHEGAGREEELLGVLILFPVAFHHYHQVRGYGSYSGFAVLPPVHESCEPCFRRLGVLIQRVLRTPLKRVGAYVGRLPELVPSRAVEAKLFAAAVERSLKAVVRPKRFLPLAVEAVTGVVNLCDSLAAGSRRGASALRRLEGGAPRSMA